MMKVLIENQTPSQTLNEPSGKLTLIYGGESNTQTAIGKDAYFENIPSSFRSKYFQLQYEVPGFIRVDTTFQYATSIVIPFRAQRKKQQLKLFKEGFEQRNYLENVARDIGTYLIKNKD